jgi:hypothetical protein
MPLLYILLGCAAILFGIECLCGVPGLTFRGMVVVLALLGSIIGIANWCILINNLRGKRFSSFIPILATVCFIMAGSLEPAWRPVIILLAVLIDPWPWVTLIGLLCLPFKRRG